jgi:hypothetical protein
VNGKNKAIKQNRERSNKLVTTHRHGLALTPIALSSGYLDKCGSELSFMRVTARILHQISLSFS